jgi:hypothetical protein
MRCGAERASCCWCWPGWDWDCYGRRVAVTRDRYLDKWAGAVRLGANPARWEMDTDGVQQLGPDSSLSVVRRRVARVANRGGELVRCGENPERGEASSRTGGRSWEKTIGRG